MSEQNAFAGSPTSHRPLESSRMLQVADLRGPEGRLEGILNEGSAAAAFSALVCHPYPPAGGTMHTKVVYRAMKVLNALGVPVLRFNFRGVGLSAGSFDRGCGEQEDVRAALDWLETTLRLPTLFVGFSFGSYVGLRATCSDPRVIGKACLGLPVRAAGRDYSYEFLPDCAGPLLFLSGAEDEFCPASVLSSLVATAKARQRTILIDGGDHFFQGSPASPLSKLDAMQEALRGWVSEEIVPVTQRLSGPTG